jgi:hypothetical protein
MWWGYLCPQEKMFVMRIIYRISLKEVDRRKKAFLALSISLFLGLILASIILKFPVPFTFFWCFLAILLLANLGMNKFFSRFLKMRIGLSNKFLIRAKEKFLIKKINKIRTKWTTNKTIREVEIFFDDGKNIFINGLGNFEKFEKNLLKKINKNAMIKNTREPMNFDNNFFYPILGLILSFGTMYLLKLITSFSYQTMQIILYALIIYVFLMGMYLIISKPIAKRY